MDRRNFCFSSAIVATGFAAGRVFPSPQVPALVPDEVVFDTRFPMARDFGTAAAALGQKTAAIRGDVTALWLDDLRRRWIAGKAPIAGMTSARSLFCLELLARDHWMRVIIRAEHRTLPGGATSHRVSARGPALANICSTLEGDANWPTRLAGALTSIPGCVAAPRARREVGSPWNGQGLAMDAQLVSWVISGEDA